MREKILLLVILFTIIGIIGCQKLKDCPCDAAKESEKIEVNKKEYLIKCMLPETVTNNTTNKLIICNHTKNIMNYRYAFSLEFFNENNWTEIPLNINWEEILLGLAPFETFEWDLNLYSFVEQHNEFKKGKYRISKYISLNTNEKYSLHIGSYDFYFEFEIK